MNSTIKRFGFLVLGLAVILAWSLPVNAAGYTMIDLGVLPGGTYSRATAINNAGQIVGYGDTMTAEGLQTHAFLYSNGVMTDLGTLPGSPWSKAYAINNAGQVVGYTEYGNGTYPFLYSGGPMTQIGPPPALNSPSLAYGINDFGQIVGHGTHINSTGNNSAFLYSGGVVTDLGPLGGPTLWMVDAYGINNAGQIVGQAWVNNLSGNACLYSGGKMQDLGTLGGVSNNWGSCANAINNIGQIVGSAVVTNGGPQHAFLYDGVMHDLGTLGTNPESCAKAINSAGQIVGWYGGGIYGRAFIYANGVMQDLGDLWGRVDIYHTWANGINDAGWIVGNSMTAKGEDHAFLARPRVPGGKISSILELLLD